MAYLVLYGLDRNVVMEVLMQQSFLARQLLDLQMVTHLELIMLLFQVFSILVEPMQQGLKVRCMVIEVRDGY